MKDKLSYFYTEVRLHTGRKRRERSATKSYPLRNWSVKLTMAPYIEILDISDVSHSYGPCESGIYFRVQYVDTIDNQPVKSIRYVRVFPNDPRPAKGTDYDILYSDFPSGDWNFIDIVRDEVTETPIFSNSRKVDLYKNIQAWHPLSIDYLDLEKVPRSGEDSSDPEDSHFWLVKHDLFPSHVCMKTANILGWSMYEMKMETSSYREIEGKGIAPKFLAHVTENGRIIGFLTEPITDGRPANPGKDYEACKNALQKLHDEGLLHGFPDEESFLVRSDGTAVLLDLGKSQPIDPTIAEVWFDREMRELKECMEI